MLYKNDEGQSLNELERSSLHLQENLQNKADILCVCVSVKTPRYIHKVKTNSHKEERQKKKKKKLSCRNIRKTDF